MFTVEFNLMLVVPCFLRVTKDAEILNFFFSFLLRSEDCYLLTQGIERDEKKFNSISLNSDIKD